MIIRCRGWRSEESEPLSWNLPHLNAKTGTPTPTCRHEVLELACRAQPDGTRKRSAEPHPLLLSLDHAFGLGFPLRSSGTNTGNFRVTHPTPAAGSAFQARGLSAQVQLSEVCQPATAFSSRFDTQMQTTNLPSLSESTSRRALFFSFYRADLVTIPNTGGTTIPSPHLTHVEASRLCC